MIIRTPLLAIILVMLSTMALQAQTPAQYFGKSYAVVVGIRDYKDSRRWPTLKNNENDANEIARLLETQGFSVKPFRGRAATKRAIESYIEDTLAPKLKSNDRVVFYFSGHGETLPKGGKDWGYVIPYDATNQSSSWISMERLQTLAGMMGSARHQLFIFDACFGGTFGLKSSLSAIPENVPDYVGVVAQAKARQYLTAGGAKERTPATSNLPGYKKYSFFTAYLIKALRDDGGDLNKDGVITASELDAYLSPAARSQYNTPRGGSFAGHEQGNFVLQASSTPVLPITPVDSISILKGGEPTPTIEPDINNDQSVYGFDITGTYISDITSNDTRFFRKESDRNFKIFFVQTGDKITGINDSVDLKIVGTRVGDAIEFVMQANRINRFNEAKGVWRIDNDNVTKIEGTWSITGFGTSEGKWNLRKVD